MRIHKAKKAKKILKTFARFFNLNIENLEIFIDSTFARQCFINNIQIENALKSLLCTDVKLVTSSCVLKECESLGKPFEASLHILKLFNALKCTHEFTNSDSFATSCIMKRLKTAQKLKTSDSKTYLFAIATNDPKLRDFARTLPGVPILFVSNRCVNIEPIDKQILHNINKKAQETTYLSKNEIISVNNIKQQFGYSDAITISRKRKKAKEPNPLACKKKKLESKNIGTNKLSETHDESSTVQRDKKKKVRLTWAMKQALRAQE